MKKQLLNNLCKDIPCTFESGKIYISLGATGAVEDDHVLDCINVLPYHDNDTVMHYKCSKCDTNYIIRITAHNKSLLPPDSTQMYCQNCGSTIILANSTIINETYSHKYELRDAMIKTIKPGFPK